MMRDILYIFIGIVTLSMSSCSDVVYAADKINPIQAKSPIVKQVEKPRESGSLMFYYMAITPTSSKAVSPH